MLLVPPELELGGDLKAQDLLSTIDCCVSGDHTGGLFRGADSTVELRILLCIILRRASRSIRLRLALNMAVDLLAGRSTNKRLICIDG